MKRIIALFALVCILLCGCAGGTTIKEEKALSELGEGTREESVAIVKVTINPEFELYLDGAFCVIKVRCLNEDAVTAFETMQAYNVPVIGARYEDAMLSILDVIKASGLLNENTDKIQVNATLLMEFPEAEMAEMSETFSAPVTYYTTEHGLNAEVEAPVPVLADDAKKVAWAGDPANGNAGQNNSAVMGTPSSELAFTIYENDAVVGEGIRYFDENGILYKETSSYTNGTTREVLYYENGKLKSDITNRPDGSIEQHFREDGTQSYYLEDTAEKYFEMAFYPNGNRESETFKQGETSITSTFYENGNMKSSISDEPDGHFEWHYYEDGKEKQLISDTDDGYSRKEYTYHENGNLQSQTTDDKYGHTEHHYSEAGTVVRKNYTDANGNIEESTFYPNGNRCTLYRKEATGSEQIWEYYENGNMQSQITDDQYGHTESYFSEDGTQVQEIVTDAVGNISDVTFYPNGAVCTAYKKEATGAEQLYEYYENSNFKYSRETKASGSYEEKTYDLNGNLETSITCTSDGEISKYAFSYWGKGRYKSKILDDSDGHFESHYYENGVDQKDIADTADSYSEYTYYPNGNACTQIYSDKNTGVYSERHYDEAGNTIYYRYVDEYGNERITNGE